MNTYIVNYTHNGKSEDAYLYANSFDEARQKLESLGKTGSVNWELLERKPVLDEDANDYIEAAQHTIAAIRNAGGKI